MSLLFLKITFGMFVGTLVGLTGLGGGVLLLPILIFFLRVPAAIALGSGSVILVLLLLYVPSAPATPVGTDVIHAFALTGFTSLLRLRLGTVDPDLVFPLLIGSVPGSLVGVRLGTALPSYGVKRDLGVVLFATGARMLWV